MAKITPFKGLRPKKEIAPELATLPYDVVNVEEARAYKSNPYHFYHVTRAEIDLPSNVDVHSQQVYDKAKENLDWLVDNGYMFQDEEPCYYIYRLVMEGRAQTGVICGSSLDDYFNGIIKKHEFTRPEKELDRINHIKTTRAQTGVVFLACNDNEDMDTIIEEWKSTHEPEYDFTAEDGVQHTLWVVDDYAKVATLTRIFQEEIPATYIADGHHRAASAAKVAIEMRESGLSITGDESFNYFVTCIFPESQLKIMDYNRVVKDLNGMSSGEFLDALKGEFEVSKPMDTQFKPAKPHEFGMYLDGKWYRLEVKPGTYSNDPIGVLDVSILQNNVLSKLLNINDPRTDKRVDFVGGIRGLGELEKRVNSGDMAAAFACYPVSIKQLFDIADSGNVMPPKSTWFEPKLRDGLVVYMI
ncbi:MAG: hypothetical protein BGO70_00875 [Bacteroidetes bacterium 43-93]|nr:DUF1015 domain-containing protein [Bacteroidota bacterium]OJW96266.1 MAG: hypothetical protein BGO70_00875 [Bacteroidetes bacterium 43-93]